MTIKDLFCGLTILIVVAAFLSIAFPQKRLRRKRRRRRRRETVYVYALKDGRKKFYVGISNRPKIRLIQHLNSAKPFGTKKEKKIWWMKRKGKKVGMDIITKTNSRSKAEDLERKYIKKWGTHNTLHR